MRILVVDDNHDGARSLAAALTLLGHNPRVAHNGAVAVKEAGLFKPHLILMDVGMAGLNGLDACRAIRRHLAFRSRIVALTGHGSEEDRQRSREADFDDHIVKPLNMEALHVLLASVEAVECQQN